MNTVTLSLQDYEALQKKANELECAINKLEEGKVLCLFVGDKSYFVKTENETIIDFDKENARLRKELSKAELAKNKAETALYYEEEHNNYKIAKIMNRTLLERIINKDVTQ
jgi:hypothetical protein